MSILEMQQSPASIFLHPLILLAVTSSGTTITPEMPRLVNGQAEMFLQMQSAVPLPLLLLLWMMSGSPPPPLIYPGRHSRLSWQQTKERLAKK